MHKILSATGTSITLLHYYCIYYCPLSDRATTTKIRFRMGVRPSTITNVIYDVLRGRYEYHTWEYIWSLTTPVQQGRSRRVPRIILLIDTTMQYNMEYMVLWRGTTVVLFRYLQGTCFCSQRTRSLRTRHPQKHHHQTGSKHHNHDTRPALFS